MTAVATATGAAAQRKKLPPAPQRVLVADDERLIADSISAALQAIGYQVVGPAADGKKAIAMAQPADGPGVDLAVLDIAMPDMTGLEAAAELWTRHAIPAVIVSAYSHDDFLAKAQASGGVFGYLLKPVTAESLRAAIAVAWSKAATELERSGRITQLEDNLRNRQTVERAKWKLVERAGLTEPEAHSRLQRAARDSRRSLAEVAALIVETDDFRIVGL
jgi:response regulator NasT